ncbi:hypothetical protein, partial [Burkholderia gladioli]|uniref:hypothetical protein n=1 Tax=Burkholderia gladioli TaxID=28095 RepID=UPI001ABABFBB
FRHGGGVRLRKCYREKQHSPSIATAFSCLIPTPHTPLSTIAHAAAMGVSTPSTLGYIPTDTPKVLGLYWATVGNDGGKKTRTARLCGFFRQSWEALGG